MTTLLENYYGNARKLLHYWNTAKCYYITGPQLNVITFIGVQLNIITFIGLQLNIITFIGLQLNIITLLDHR